MRQAKNNWYMFRLFWKASPKRIIFAMITNIFGIGVDTLISIFLLRFIINAYQKHYPFAMVALFLLGILLLNITSSILDVLYNRVIIPVTKVQIQQSLMEHIYNQAISVDLNCYENPEFYDNYTKANEELFARSEKMIENFSFLAAYCVNIFISAVTIMMYEPILLLVAIIPKILEQFIRKKYISAKYEKYQATTYHRRQMDYVKRTIYLSDFAKDLRLTNIFEPIMKSFHMAATDMRTIYRKYGKNAAFYRFFLSIVSSLILYLAGQGLIIFRFLNDQAYTLAVLSSLLNAVYSFNGLIGEFSWRMADFYENGTFAENFRTFLEYKTKMPENADGKTPTNSLHTLSLNDVTFTYQGAKEPVLKHISLQIKPGEKIALVGHNGAGKSTLVKLLMRLYDVTEGSISLDGSDIREFCLSQYRDLFGTIFQDFKMFATSVTENILLHPAKDSTDEARAIKAAKKSGIYNKIMHFPNGMNSQVTKEFDQEGLLLSGGEFQKMAIARVFVKNSSIAILDEPSSALDPISEYEIFENMMKACDGKSVIFVSHRLSSVVMADKIYMLENGEIIEQGSHQSLLEQNGKYAHMFQMQAENYQKGLAYEA